MKKNILLISLISLLFISCENALSNIDHSSVADNPAVTATPSENGKTYISLGDIRLSTESRTINPSYIIDNLSSVYLKSKRSASDSSFGTLITNASSYSDACSRSLEIEPGIWDFRLSAYLYDFEFAGTTTIEVEAGTINTLNFDLVTTNTSSYPYGLIDITVDFTGNADKVVATLKEKSTSSTTKLTKTYTATDTTNPITSVEGEDFRRINFRTAKSSSSGVTTGKYYLLLEFYNDETLVNSIENIVRVENNFTTKATLNLALDSLYSATYKFYKEDDSSNTELTVASGQSIPEGVDFEIAGSVLSNKVSTKSTLPNLTYPGYTFAGWYKATPFTAENKITSIPSNLSSSPTLYAYFTSVTTSPDLYVNSSADPDLADGSQSHPYASISAALERIENLDNATDYTIIVDGEYVSSESTRIEITKATSLTITGKTGNAADSLDAQSEGIPLIINTAVPVTVKNIKITKGSPYGIQLLSGKLTLEENTLISENKTGVLISGGEVIMTDGEISSNTADYGAGVYITYDDLNKTLGKFTMSGGTISGNTAQYGCGGGVLVDGTLYAEPEELAEYTGGDGDGHVLFTMSNGTISGNEENSTVTDDYEVGVGGGGVCVAGQYAKFVMSDSAVIKTNSAPAYGAGVSVWNGAQFIMNGGTIGGSSPDDGNITGEEVEISTFGGGVYLGGDESSSFTMNNGTISNNKALGLGAKPFGYDTPSNCGGAGVGIFYGTFTMVNGNITNNNSKRHGGGVYIAGHGIFDMQGGSISGNTCTDNGKAINQNWVSNSGVTYYGQLKMKGNAVVTSNNDVYLCDKLTITGSLSGTSPVATLTPSSYTITSNSEPLIEVTTDSETSVGSEYNKFAITPDSGNNYELSNEGKLVASSNGGNGHSPNLDDFSLVSGAIISTNLANSGFSDCSSEPITIRDLYVCTHEVTQAEYTEYCSYGGTAPNDGDSYPVYNVSWYDAIVYCNLRSLDESLMPVYSIDNKTNPAQWPGKGGSGGKYCGPDETQYQWEWNSGYPGYDSIVVNNDANGYRLPTAIEWEYFARGGNGLSTDVASLPNSGCDDDNLKLYAHVASWDETRVDTDNVYPIMEKNANTLGLYDLCGNVKELCFDVQADGDYRTTFDGYYIQNGQGSIESYTRDSSIGFRVVRNVHNSVDFGTGVKWATTNVGAETIADYGAYYAWGETDTRYNEVYRSNKEISRKSGYTNGYSWTGYEDGTNGADFTKYTNVSGNNVLSSTDDVATQKRGAKWRMPTPEECQALLDACYMIYTEDYNGSKIPGVVLYKAKDPADAGKNTIKYSSNPAVATYSYSDTHIFFPAAGYFTSATDSDCGLNSFKSDVLIWTNTIWENYTTGDTARMVPLKSDAGYTDSIDDAPRYYGFSVRPVYIGD